MEWSTGGIFNVQRLTSRAQVVQFARASSLHFIDTFATSTITKSSPIATGSTASREYGFKVAVEVSEAIARRSQQLRTQFLSPLRLPLLVSLQTMVHVHQITTTTPQLSLPQPHLSSFRTTLQLPTLSLLLRSPTLSHMGRQVHMAQRMSGWHMS